MEVRELEVVKGCAQWSHLIRIFSEPYDGIVAFSISLKHNRHLLVSFLVMELVNAQLIHPQPSGSGLIVKVRQGNEQAFRDDKNLPCTDRESLVEFACVFVHAPANDALQTPRLMPRPGIRHRLVHRHFSII